MAILLNFPACKIVLSKLTSSLQSELDETQTALQAAQRLSEQLDKKTEAIAALKEEGQALYRNLLPNHAFSVMPAFSLKLVLVV